MNKNYTYEQLIEKLVRAKISLEKIQHKSHSSSCPVDYDPEGYAPCNCGASSHNAEIKRAIEHLEL